MTPRSSLIGLFLDTVRTHRNPAQFMRKRGGTWESISAERARADVEALGLALVELGIRRGDRVALLSENRYEWAITDLAVLGLCAVTVPIYPTLTAQQVRFVLENSEAKAIIVSTAMQLEKVRSVAGALPALQTIVCMDGCSEGAGDATTPVRDFAAVLASGATLRDAHPGAFAALAEMVQPDDLATIIYTSGTTGEPKGAVLTHDNIAFNVRACLEVATIGPADRCLSFLPLCHIFERMAGMYAMLMTGAGIAYADSLDTVAADAVAVRPTILNGVPRFYEKVYARVMENVQTQSPLRRAIFAWGRDVGVTVARAHFNGGRVPLSTRLQAGLADRLVGHKVRERVGGRLRFCISGGAPLAPKVMEFFFAIGIPVMEGYGLTETSPVICLNPPGHERPGSVGKPIPGVEVMFGADGEILTRGPHVMKGYYRNEAATREAIRDGWFHTGDIGRIDERGYVFITDRLKELLVTAGGKKVAPQPLEAKLKTSKWVSEAVLIGDRRPYIACLIVPNMTNLEAEAKARGWGVEPRAALLARPEVQAIYQAEVDRVNADLARFEQIKRFGLLERELSQESGELTPTLKIKRRVIAEKFGSIIEELYAGHISPLVD